MIKVTPNIHSKYLILSFLFLTLGITSNNGQNLPSQRATDWSMVGSECLSYTDTILLSSLGIDATGATDCSSVITAAFTSLPATGGVVVFPIGNFKINASINVPDNIHLMGQGASSTILKFDLGGNNHLITLTGSVSSQKDTLLSSVLKNSHTLSIPDVSAYGSGDIIRIREDDAGRITSSWASNTIGQIVKIDSVDAISNTIYIKQPIHIDFNTSNFTRIQKIIPGQNIKISCLTLIRDDATSGQTSNIYMSYAYNCKLDGIASYNCNNAHVSMNNSFNNSVENSYFKDAHAYGSGGQGYGVTVQVTSCDNLIQNNIFNHLRHSMLLQAGSNGNVFGYNYSLDPHWTGVSLPAASAGDMVLHGNYVFLNLFEGNICQNIVIDDSHGINGPYNTFFRNRAQLYGIFMNSSPASDAQNFIGNEVTNTGFLLGMYNLSGSNHFEYGNNHNGTIKPSGTSTLTDTSYYLQTQPYFWDFNTSATPTSTTPFPNIGYPVPFNSQKNIAYQNFSSGDYTTCSLDTLEIFQSICKNTAIQILGNNYASAGIYTAYFHNGNCNVPYKLNLSEHPLVDINWIDDTLTTVNNAQSYEWYLDGNSVGNNTNVLQPNANGNYEVAVTFSDNTTCYSEVYALTNIGLTELENNKINISPNPFNSNVNILSANQINIFIFNLNGQLVYESHQKKRHHNLTLETLTTGIYILKTIDMNGAVSYSKIVKG